MFEVIVVRNLAEALRVKGSSVFELVHHTFYERDFIFFARLTAHLSKITGCDEKDAMEFGKLSELLYLSSLLHFSLTEVTENTEQLRAEKQMPVLLGDLLYGRFITALTESGKTAYLPIYLAYLKHFNVDGVDALEGRIAYTMDDAAALLTEKTAEVMALFTECAAETLLAEANVYLRNHWEGLRGEKISSFAVLEALLQKEFSQGAMVC